MQQTRNKIKRTNAANANMKQKIQIPKSFSKVISKYDKL